MYTIKQINLQIVSVSNLWDYTSYTVFNSGWDLIIVDEAHRVAGSSGEVARHKLGQLLAAASPYLLLLTATSHSGKTDPFLRLVRLIDEKAFPNARAVVKKQVAPYVIRTEKREAIDNIGIEHIRKHKVHSIMKERKEYQNSYTFSNKIIPDLLPVLVVRME